MMNQLLGMGIISFVIALVGVILWFVFLYFFISAIIRRGIDTSVLRDQTDELEEYHRNMLALESEKIELLRMRYQQPMSQPQQQFSSPSRGQSYGQETMAYPPQQ